MRSGNMANMNPQTYANHTRLHPPFHFFVVPVMVVNFIWCVVQSVMTPGWDAGRWVFVSAALLVLMLLVRINPLRAQDRIIRLEEKLRYQQVLSPALFQQTSTLRMGQIVALRFAPDNELEGLVSAVLAGQLSKPAQIKQAIKNWRGDAFRV
jgi:Family of unknown function (DUF6526)